MAVGQAQHAVRELPDTLEKKGTKGQFAIHPVAVPRAAPFRQTAPLRHQAQLEIQVHGDSLKRSYPSSQTGTWVRLASPSLAKG